MPEATWKLRASPIAHVFGWVKMRQRGLMHVFFPSFRRLPTYKDTRSSVHLTLHWYNMDFKCSLRPVYSWVLQRDV